MAARMPVLMLASIRCDASNPQNGAVRKSEPEPLRLSLSKPSWIVKSESNVRREVKKKPNPPCVICHGSGRVDCHDCSGKGRGNHVDLAMLPKGVWPKWCKTCRGSGLSHCSRCLGTGEYRYVMGFQFMKREINDPPNPPQPPTKPKQRSAMDLLLNGEDDDPSDGEDQSSGTTKPTT